MGCCVWKESPYTFTFELKSGGIEHAGKALSPVRAIPKQGKSKAHRLFASKDFSPRLTNHIVTVARKKKVDPVLVYAVMNQESGFRLDARSPVGASGLMQVMPDHFTKPAKKTDKGAYYSKMFGSWRVKTKDYHNRFDPYINVNYGMGFLADALKDAKGDLKIALSLYNSGKKNGYLRFRETKNYVASITSHYNKLKGA